MICVNKLQQINLELEKHVKAEELAALLGIDVVSAEELMNGSIPFTSKEFTFVTSHLGIPAEGLV